MKQQLGAGSAAESVSRGGKLSISHHTLALGKPEDVPAARPTGTQQAAGASAEHPSAPSLTVRTAQAMPPLEGVPHNQDEDGWPNIQEDSLNSGQPEGQDFIARILENKNQMKLIRAADATYMNDAMFNKCG